MKITDFLKPELVIGELIAKDKPAILREFALKMAEAHPHLAANELERVL